MKTTENKTALYQTYLIVLSFDQFDFKKEMKRKEFTFIWALCNIANYVWLIVFSCTSTVTYCGCDWSPFSPQMFLSSERAVLVGQVPATAVAAQCVVGISLTHSLLRPSFPTLSPQIPIIRGVVESLTHYCVPHSRRCRLKYPLSGVWWRA